MKKFISIALLGLPLMAAADCSLVYGGYQAGNTFNGPATCSGQSDSVTVNGSLTLSSATASSLTVNGPLNASGSQISSATVEGAVNANSSKISDMTVNGPATLSNVTINNLTINGALQASGSNISMIEANGDLTFTNSTIGNITIDQTSGSGAYKIYLLGNTVVNGNIVYKQGNGIVYKAPGAKVTGSVSGATVQNY